MTLAEAYAVIWRAKLEGQSPPEKQSIDRVNWTAELWRERFAGDLLTGPLLDCGVGSGAMLAKARESGIEAIGLDFDGPLLEWLGSCGYAVARCDLNVDALPGSGYQIVTACDSIEHLIDPHHLLAEMHRVLAPGGLAIVATPNCGYWKRVKQLAEGCMFSTSGDPVLRDGGHLSYWAPRDLEGALRQAGFRNVRVEYKNRDPAPRPWRFGPWSEHAYMLGVGEK